MQPIYIAQIVLFVFNLNFYPPVSGRSGYLDRLLEVMAKPFFFLDRKFKRAEFVVGLL
jgi:hypothetical protein